MTNSRPGFPRVSFRIRRVYFDAIVRGEKNIEVRRMSPYWTRAVGRLRDDDMGRCGVAVFVCGHDVYECWIQGVRVEESARDALGREPNEQGRLDLGDGPVFAFELGPEVHPT